MSTMTMNKKDETQKNDSHPVREGVADLKRDAQDIKDDLDVLKDDAVKLGTHATQHTIEAAKSGVQSSTEFAKGACDTVKSYQDGMNKQIRSHPTTSVLIALGAGMLVGRVLGSMRR
jgi:ElaB/YqjD/DUF883 family membrane-anchored ribosome-binding protein